MDGQRYAPSWRTTGGEELSTETIRTTDHLRQSLHGMRIMNSSGVSDYDVVLKPRSLQIQHREQGSRMCHFCKLYIHIRRIPRTWANQIYIVPAINFPFQLDSLKSRLQTTKTKISLPKLASLVYREEGIVGFYRGIWIPLTTISFVRKSAHT